MASIQTCKQGQTQATTAQAQEPETETAGPPHTSVTPTPSPLTVLPGIGTHPVQLELFYQQQLQQRRGRAVSEPPDVPSLAAAHATAAAAVAISPQAAAETLTAVDGFRESWGMQRASTSSSMSYTAASSGAYQRLKEMASLPTGGAQSQSPTLATIATAAAAAADRSSSPTNTSRLGRLECQGAAEQLWQRQTSLQPLQPWGPNTLWANAAPPTSISGNDNLGLQQTPTGWRVSTRGNVWDVCRRDDEGACCGGDFLWPCRAIDTSPTFLPHQTN